MKTLHLATLVVLLVTQVWCKDEPSTKLKTKREVYYPPTYPESYECKSPPTCLHPSKIPNSDSNTPADGWILQTTLFYVTMETCWGYSSFANMLLGRKVFSPRELEEMCLTSFFGNSTFTTFSGYGNQLYQTCALPSAESSQNNCSTVAGDSGTDWNLQAYELDYAVLSDGMSWVLYYRCVGGRYGDFILFSTRPYLEQSVVTQVMAMVVNQLDFSATDIKLLPCNFPTYPVPLQNYPEPDSALSKSCSYPNPYSPYPQQTPVVPNNPPHYNSHPNHPNPY